MSSFKIKDDQKIKIYSIACKMKEEGLDSRFITNAVDLAFQYRGVYGLFELWDEENEVSEKGEIIADIQEEIEEEENLPRTPTKKPYINFEDIEFLIKHNKETKKFLKNRVEQWGGISKLAKETGIPQPSLSRFFNSASTPRKATIQKILDVLDISQKDLNAWGEHQKKAVNE